MYKSLLLIIISLFIVLSSCRIHTNRGYITSTPNISNFQEKGDARIKTKISIRSMELQSSYAINNKFGISAEGLINLSLIDGINALINNEPFHFKHYGANLGALYYKDYNKRYFEILIGGGFVKNKSNFDYYSARYENFHYFYNNIYIQPTISFKKENTTHSITLKTSFIKYYFYEYSYRDYDIEHVSAYDYDSDITSYDFMYFKNKYTYANEISYSANIKVDDNINFIFSTGFSIVNKIAKSKPFYYDYRGKYDDPYNYKYNPFTHIMQPNRLTFESRLHPFSRFITLGISFEYKF